MPAQSNKSRTRRAHPALLTRPLLLALAAAACAQASADEPSPYYIGASESVVHDSNVYRGPSAISDTYSTTSLLGGFDQSFGRQHLYGNANIGFNRYRSQNTLDNTSYGLSAGWDLQTINDLSGGVGVTANQSLATQNGNQAVVDANGNPIAPSNTRNIVKTDQLSANLRWGGAGPFSLSSAYAHSQVKYSQTQTSESSGDTFSVIGDYRLGPTVTAGAGLRFTRSRSPYGTALVANPTSLDDYASTSTNGRNVDLTMSWRISPQTGLDARLSFTRQSSAASGSNDFSGLTGGLTANYAPTSKLIFGATYSRDAGTNGAFFNVAPGIATGSTTTNTTASTVLLSENSTVSDALGLSASYLVTSKISTNAGVQYRRSKSSNGFNGAGGDSTDRLRTGTLGVSYAAGRNWNLGCNLSHEARDFSGAVGYSYSDNTVGCSVQITLR